MATLDLVSAGETNWATRQNANLTALNTELIATTAKANAAQVAADLDDDTAALVADSESALRTELNAAYAPAMGIAVVTDTRWAGGADPNGVADSTAAITAAYGSGAKHVQFPAGTFLCPNGLPAIPQGVNVTGVGAADMDGGWGTRIRVTSLTANGLAHAGKSGSIRDIYVHNTATAAPTAGAGIQVTNGEGFSIRNTVVTGFYAGIDIDRQFYTTLATVRVHDWVRYGTRLRNTYNSDIGDTSLISCTFAPIAGPTGNRACDTCVRLESGGGLRVTSCKTNWGGPGRSPRVGLEVIVPTSTNTSDLILTGNSFENCEEALIRVVQTGSPLGIFRKIVIVGNELSYTVKGVEILANVVSGPDRSLRNVVISGNSFSNMTNSVWLDKVGAVAIGPNVHDSIRGDVIYHGPGCTYLSIEPQTYGVPQTPGDPVVLYRRVRGGTPSQEYPTGRITVSDSTGVPASVTTSVWGDLYRVDLSTYSAAHLEFDIEGVVAGEGTFAKRFKRELIRDGSDVNVLTAGTDVSNGTGAVDIALEKDGTTGGMVVRAKLSDGSIGTAIQAQARITVWGDGMAKVTRLTTPY